MRRAILLVVLLAACRSAAPAGKAGGTVTFTGLGAVAPREMLAAARRELDAFDKRGRREADAADAAYAMEILLREEGYAHAAVAFAVEPDQLRFDVSEGLRVYLAEVLFEGVAPERLEAVRRFFAYAGTGLLDGGSPLFRLPEIEGSASEVQRFYLLEGFLRVRMEPPEVEWNAERDLVRVTIRLDEGRSYHVRAVDFGTQEEVETGVVGHPYHVRVPVEVAARVRRQWLDRGHQEVSVDVEAEIDDAAGDVTLLVHVAPGPPVHARHVEFSGQDRTRASFLRRRFLIREGDLLAQELLDQGMENLYRSGLFRAVRLRLNETEGEENDVAVALEELKARSVDFELGYGSYELARGAVRYRDRNLLGLGRRLLVEVRGSVRSAGAELRLEDPWILGPRNTLEVGGGVLQREEPSFDLQSLRFDLAVRHRFNGPYVGRFGYDFRAEEARNVTGDITEVDTGGFLRTAGLFATLRRDTRDAVLVPSSGSLAIAGVRWSSPLLAADLDFLEMTLSAARYIPLSQRTVFAAGFRFAARELLDDSGTLPIQERLFLGGESSVRSFREGELGPVDAEGDATGGLTVLEASLELRHRVWRDLHGAIFYDVGFASPQAFSITGPPGHALGLGLRYLFPVGPARIDVAWNPGRRFAATDGWALHIAFGFSF